MIKLNENVDYDILIDQSLNKTLIKYQCGLTSTLSQKNNHFIDLLAPIFLNVNRKHTFINDIDVIRQLETYASNGYFTSTTIFITIDFENLYTMIPRVGALAASARFCIKYPQQVKISTCTTDHIMKMARLILDNNCFAYNNKYYKQVRGGAMGSAFTQVLANICHS